MRPRAASLALGALLVGALAGGLGVWLVTRGPLPLPPAPTGAARAPGSYSGAVARAVPSVVSIFATRVGERPATPAQDPLPPYPYGGRPAEQARRAPDTSLGSGVIVSREGHVLTNRHILEGADGIRVVLPDGGQARATLVGQDPDTDLAVLRVEGVQATPIPLGDPDRLEVGDVVLAIGNPYGIGQTVTLGIVSATGRSHLGISSFENFIQTDAAINPGNSGGALVDATGALVGINTAIYSKSGGSHGIGFAVPADLAMGVLEQLVRRGKVVRGWIGLTGRDVTRANREAFALQSTSGVLVSGVVAEGPAARAGLRGGDVVTQVDERGLARAGDLLEIIANAGPDRDLTLVVWRGSQRLELTVHTAERPAQDK